MTDLFGHTKILALSWKQPYGSAMLVGKDETRTWATKYRGLVLQCTSAVGYSIRTANEISGAKQMKRLMDAVVPVADTLSLFGMAISIGRLANCRLMQPKDEDRTFVQYRAPWRENRKGKDGCVRTIERRLYVHEYEDVRPLKPFPWKGSQGWTIVGHEHIHLIHEQYPDLHIL